MTLRTQGTVGQLKRALAKLNPLTTEAVLVTNDSRPMVLGVFERDRLTPELAEDICALVDEHAEARPGTEATLVFRSADGKTLSEKIVTPAARVQTDDDVYTARFATGGDPLSQAQNAQRHLEVMSRIHAQTTAENFKALREVLRDVTAQLTEERKFTRESQVRQLELARELSEIEVPAPAPTGDQDADAQAAQMQVQVIEMLKPIVIHLAPVIAQKLLAPTVAPASAVAKTSA